MSRAAERSRSSTGGILLDGGPFDCAQGALAKAIVILDADNRITFATRIAGAILGGFFRDADGSTTLTEPGTGLEGFYDFGGFVKVWESQFFCKAVVHFGCGFGFHGDAGQDRDVEFL